MFTFAVYNYINDEVMPIPISLEDDKCFCTHNQNGEDEFQFELPKASEYYGYIAEEVKVKAFSNMFLVKKIEEQSDFVIVKCTLDFDDWYSQIYIDYRKTNINLPNVLATILPTGWSIQYGDGVNLTKRTTVEYQEGQAFRAATAKEILAAIAEAYTVIFNYDTTDKVLSVLNIETYTPSGDYFIEDLNMSNLKFTGDSSNFITRLYVYGKKDDSTGQYLTIASVNDGKEYLEDFTYSDKVVCGSLIDERYTIPQHLKDYGESVLAEKCVPVRSYSFDVNNSDGKMYLYKVVTIVDKNRKLRLNYRCIKFVEYNNHSYDVVTLSSITPSIESMFGGVSTAQSIMSSNLKTAEENIQSIESLVLGTLGGYFKWVLDDTGNKSEFLILIDATTIGQATKLFKLDNEGLKYSSTGYSGTYTTIINDSGLVVAASATYSDLQNKPTIEGVTIAGNQSFEDWNLVPLTDAEIDAIMV